MAALIISLLKVWPECNNTAFFGPKTRSFVARQEDELMKFSMGLKTDSGRLKKVLTFCHRYGILLSVAGVVRSRNSGNSCSFPITHQAKRLGMLVVILKLSHFYEGQGGLKQG
jgi:hypothetical protein